MPSYDQLDNEAAWREEIAPPALITLASRIKAHFPGVGVWIRGDNNHLRGYHRSRRWIQESIYCTDRNYSVSRTPGDRGGGNPNWACAVDVAAPMAILIPMCRRLDAACRLGNLEKITEWFGNVGNDTSVDGWDNIANRPATSDSSHLTHLHMSFDRGRANEDHTDVFLTLIGVLDVNPGDVQEIWQNYLARNSRNMADNVGETWKLATDIKAKLDQLVISPIDVAALAAAISVILEPRMEAAAERAVRDVLGTLDNPGS